MAKEKKLQPAQKQRHQPGREYKMRPRPKAVDEDQRGSQKLQDKAAIITGGDSGIGRAVAVAFAKETRCFVRYERSFFRPVLPKAA